MNILRKCCTAKVLNSFILLDKRTFPIISGVSNYTDITDEITSFIRYFHASAVLNKRPTKKRKSEVNERDITYFSVRKRKRVFEVWKNMTVADLGSVVGADADFVFELMEFVDNTEKYTHPNQVIDDWNVICDIISKLNGRLTIIAPPKNKPVEEKLKDVYRRPPPDESKLVKRPPVVTIMGHVDHGKTTLLDALRHTSVVSGEFGGITQHIGAFSVKVSKGEITFLDTPGHAAFSSMRNRGAHCTDIVVLVVAADDGVMEQTMESVRMANDAKVPLIVAINKIDKPDADIERTKKMLMANNILTEEFGGDVQCVCISALKGINLDGLIDAVLTQAEINNIRGDPTGLIEGVVIESKLDRYRGSLSTILVQRGTLRKGAILVAGTSWAKVRNMFNAQQKIISEAPPSTPVETIGWHSLPQPGDIIIEVEQEKKAREVVEYRTKKKLEKKALEKDLPEIQKKMEEHYREYKPLQEMKRRLGKIYLPNKLVMEKKSTTETKEKKDVFYNIVVKGDVEGSMEAILDVLVTYNSPLCKFDVIHYGVGNVSLGDVEIAEVFKGDIYTFNIGVLPEAKTAAEQKNIAIRPHNVIYRLVDEIKVEINKRLPPKVEEEIVGEAKVLQLFLIQEGKQKNLPVAGCAVLNGELKSNLNFKIIRNDKVIHTGPVYSIRHLKQVVQVIKKGQECGIRFEDTSVLFQSGDIIQCFKYYNVPQEIKWDPF